MTSLNIDLTSIPNYLTYPAHDETRAYLLRDLEMSCNALGIASPPTQPGGEWWLLAGMFASQADVVFASLQIANGKLDPAYAEGDDLDDIRERLGLPELPATGGSGTISATYTGNVTFVAGDQVVFPGGLRGAVTDTVSYTGAGVGLVSIAMIDTGVATNFPENTTCRWVNQPTNAFQTAMAYDDFTGGTDAESDASKRLRIIDYVRNAQTYGNPAWILSQIEAFPAASYAGSATPDAAYTYRAAGGPGTFKIAVLNTGSLAGSGSRAVSSTTITALRTYLSGLVPPEVHFDVVNCSPVPTDAAVQIAFNGASGQANWTDALDPWPTLGSGQTTIGCSGAASYTLSGVTAQTAPTPGAHITISTATGEFLNYTVQSSSGSAGAYTVVVTTPLSALVTSSSWIFPAVTVPSGTLSSLWYDAMGTLAPGELTTDSRMAQCKRYPSATSGGAGKGIMTAVGNLQTTLSSAVAGVYLLTTPSLPSTAASVASLPYVLTPKRFAAYPMVF